MISTDKLPKFFTFSNCLICHLCFSSSQVMYLVARIIFMVLEYSLTPTVTTMVNIRWVNFFL